MLPLPPRAPSRLELALAGDAHGGSLQGSMGAPCFRRLVKVWTIVLPNLVLGRPVVREYVDEMARPEALARALKAAGDGHARAPGADRSLSGA
jgi:lipid-A-disaccharide synthase